MPPPPTIELCGRGRTVVGDLFPVVYDELRDIARRQLRGERAGHTLATTALVHEAYERLVDQTRTTWEGRAHFCAVAAQAMRRILIDYARRRTAQKRGGGVQPLDLDDVEVGADEQATLVLSVDQALGRLAAFDARAAHVVELRFFGGMTEAEIAEVLDVTPRTVRRDWVKAKVWLHKELHPPGDPADEPSS